MDVADLSGFPPPPRHVTVGPRSFRIWRVAPGHRKLEGSRGCTHWEPTEIYIDVTRSAREQFELVWHEITHAVNEEFGLEQPRKRITEERVATIHGHGWTQVFLDNPALLAWLDLATNYIKSEQENA